jgi:hypothetical protein
MPFQARQRDRGEEIRRSPDARRVSSAERLIRLEEADARISRDLHRLMALRAQYRDEALRLRLSLSGSDLVLYEALRSTR